jgi:hypothetical protein
VGNSNEIKDVSFISVQKSQNFNNCYFHGLKMELEDYTERAIMVKGDTMPYMKELKKAGGRWYGYHQGWIFPKTKKSIVQKLVDASKERKSSPGMKRKDYSQKPITEKGEEVMPYVEDYSEKSIIVRGDTRPYKEEIKKAGGSWNKSLQGWIFPKTKKSMVQDLVDAMEKIDEDIVSFLAREFKESESLISLCISDTAKDLKISKSDVSDALLKYYLLEADEKEEEEETMDLLEVRLRGGYLAL